MGSGFPAFGADALRFTLATFPPSNKRIALAPKRIEGNRHFVNKIWNATRFSLDALKGHTWRARPAGKKPEALFNRWILDQLNEACRIAHAGLGAFRVDESANELYRFFWNDFCDWHVELTKSVFAEGSPDARFADETRQVIAEVLETSLRLLHPLMPYVTEELWQRVPKPPPPGRKISIAFGPWPEFDAGAKDPDAKRDFEVFKSVVGAARTIRSEHEVHWSAATPFSIASDAPEVKALFAACEHWVRSLVKTDALRLEKRDAPRAPGTAVAVVASPFGPIEVRVGLKGFVEKDKEKARIERELKKIAKDLEAIERKLASKGFADRAPKEVIDETMALKAQLVEAKTRLEEARTLADEL
jgi:valyl-tRNA synthetase